jgi:hypothetical protein
MYFTFHIFWQLLHLLQYIPQEENVLFTPLIFPDTQKYLLHYECLAWQEICSIHTFIKRTSLVIPTVSDLAKSLNTHAPFVNYVWVLECAPYYKKCGIIYTFTFVLKYEKLHLRLILKYI